MNTTFDEPKNKGVFCKLVLVCVKRLYMDCKRILQHKVGLNPVLVSPYVGQNDNSSYESAGTVDKVPSS